MISILFEERDGLLCARSQGHADYFPGQDPVCAAASALMFSLLGSLVNLTAAAHCEKEIAPGLISLRYRPVSKHDRQVARLLFASVHIGLLQLEASYPAHVSLQAKNF